MSISYMAIERVRLRRSPKSDKKWRVTFENGKTVDFGARSYSDYTFHKNPARMRSYVGRHGGVIPKALFNEMNPASIQKKMLRVRTSIKEKWGSAGIRTPGFWSRWLTWSFPTVAEAKKFIEKTYGVQFL
tara:strand:+ start:8158 stop:8547 length:390 start_codon:yes stop_codon:yes gene_type:complete